MSNRVVGLPFYPGREPSFVVENVIGPDVMDVLLNIAKDHEVVVSGSTIITTIATGGFMLGEQGTPVEDKVSDIDVYVGSKAFEALCTAGAGEKTVGRYSASIQFGSREVNIINVDEMRKSWVESITELLNKLDIPEDVTFPDIVEIPPPHTTLSQQSQHEIRVFMASRLRAIVSSLTEDASAENFLRHNGLFSSETLGVVLGNSGTISVLKNTNDFLHKPSYRRGQLNQYRTAYYTGMTEVEINPESLTGVLLYASLLDEPIELSTSLLPYKLATGIARTLRTVAERKIQLAGAYEQGQVSPQMLWYNALYASADKLAQGIHPLVLENAGEQSEFEYAMRYKMQKEFARAVSQDPVQATAQMFYALPLSQLISPNFSRNFAEYHKQVLPNSVYFARFFQDGEYRDTTGNIVTITDKRLEQAQVFMLNLLAFMSYFYQVHEVDTVVDRAVTSGSGLTYTRIQGPANMSEAMALLLCSLGYRHDQQTVIEQVCNAWLVTGLAPRSYNTGLTDDFNMAVEPEVVSASMQRFETAVKQFDSW